MTQNISDIDDARLAQAADWHARLLDEAALEADWVAFTVWLGSHEQNKCAYDRIEDLAIALDQPEGILNSALPQAKAAESTPLAAGSESDVSNVVDARARFTRPQVWAGIAAAAAAVWLVAVNVGGLLTADPATEYYQTVENTRVITLADGSSVHLNINSKLEVTLAEDGRRTTLEYGEALFKVAADKERPFTVALGDRRVRVVGTVFNVLRHSGNVSVTVSEGIVDVAPRSEPDAAERLTAGKQLLHKEGAADMEVRDVDAGAVIAWHEGYLEYEAASLDDVVADLNRYFALPIKLEGDITALTFSGILSTEDQNAVLELLVGVLPIEAVKTDKAIILKRKI